MKKIILITLFTLLGLTQAVAQEYEYVPFVREGVKWECSCFNFLSDLFPYGVSYYTLEMKGDTVIDGKHYKPVHLYSGESINEENDTVPVYLREEDKVVYAYIPDGRRYVECPVGIGQTICGYDIDWAWSTGEEHILYDFNDMAGFYDYLEETSGGWVWGQVYQGSDMVMVSDRMVKRYKFRSDSEFNKYTQYIIEGLGYIGIDGMPLSYFQWETTGMQNGYHLERVIEDGQVIYENGDFPFEYNYVPFVREGVKWTYEILDYHYWEFHTNPARGDGRLYRTLELKGDTAINGKTYKAIHKYSGDAINWEQDTIPVYLREEDKKVYGIIPDGKRYDDCPVYNRWTDYDPWSGSSPVTYNGQEFVLYDFDDPVAYWDSIFSNAGESYYYQHLYTDTITVGDHLAKRHRGALFGALDYQIIEGIGQVARNTSPLYYEADIMPGFHCQAIYSLKRVLDNDEVIYSNDYTDDRYMPLIREGVKWVYEKVAVNNGDTTYSYYTYEFRGNHPDIGNNNHTRKALYRYEGRHHELDVETDSLVAGLRENEAFVMYYRNEPLNQVVAQGRNMINFDIDYQIVDEYDMTLYGLGSDDTGEMSRWVFIDHQREPFLNDVNFIKVEPIMIDGYLCSRLAYVNEDGKPLAYVVEGIGFDSYDMGDLLTPFTCRPDPEADYQEWCGLSHVIKDGQIIYKGMRYRNGVVTGVEDLMTDKTSRPLDPRYYDLMGRALGTEVPTTPGIYIHQGKKVMVR